MIRRNGQPNADQSRVTLRNPRGHRRGYWLRAKLVPFASLLGRLAGLSWPKLGLSLGKEVLLAQARRLPPPVTTRVPDRPLRVVFLTMMGANHRLSTVEFVLGRALVANGHQVTYVVCDQALPACQVKWAGRESTWRQSCAKCYEFGRRLLSATKCEVRAVTDIVGDKRGTGKWPEYVESEMLKIHRVGILDESDAAVQRRRSLLESAASISEALGEQLAHERPDRVIMSHGIYCTWGPARETLLQAGIPVITWGNGTKKDTIKLNWKTVADLSDIENEWVRVSKNALTPAQQKRLDGYLQSRRDHSRDRLVYNFGGEEAPDEIRQRLGLSPGKPTFVLFTNVLWDAASTHRELAFANPIEWVMETIDWFSTEQDRQLVVKIHPAEVVIGTNQPFSSLIASRFPELPGNVKVIRPEEKINSWSVIRTADVGLVHTSTVGLEIALEGRPCVVVSHTHYRGKGLTVDIRDREGYFETLRRFPDPAFDAQSVRQFARRYAYLWFERYHHHFGYFTGVSIADPRAFRDVDGTTLSADPTVRRIVESIESGTDFLIPESEAT